MSADKIVNTSAMAASSPEPFVFLVTVFVLAVFIGFYVVWSVTPALHSPLMSVTNAISGIIIIGSLTLLCIESDILNSNSGRTDLSIILGYVATVIASINIFGGFVVTQRMLSMYKKKNK